MDLDLSRALHDAARSGTAHRPPLAAGPVLQRIHRRRAARVAVESTVGVAAAGAVAVGAVQVTAMRSVTPAPAPAATSTTAPSPTPLPATGFPPAVTVAGDLACDALPEITDPTGDAELRFESALVVGGITAQPPADGSGIPLTAGEPVTVDAVLVNGTGAPVDVLGTGTPQVWFVRGDGTVAGYLATTPNPAATTPYAGGPGARFSGERLAGIPTGCSAADAATGPLAPGVYQAYVVQRLEQSGDNDVSRLVTGPPVLVAVTDPEADDTDAPAGAAPDPHPDLEDLVLSRAGLGPLVVGVPPELNPGAAMIKRDPDHCDPEIFPGTEPARWVPSGYPPHVRDGEARQAFHVDADDDGVHRIDVLEPTIATAEGVRVGSTLAELQAAYPALEGPFGEGDSRVWWLTGPTGTLVFETVAQGPDGMPSPDALERVMLMRVLAAGADPRFTAAYSDNIAGGCL